MGLFRRGFPAAKHTQETRRSPAKEAYSELRAGAFTRKPLGARLLIADVPFLLQDMDARLTRAERKNEELAYRLQETVAALVKAEAQLRAMGADELELPEGDETTDGA